MSLEWPTPGESVAGVLNPREPWSAQPRLSLERAFLAQPTPWHAQPQSVPGVPNPRVSLPKEGGDVRSKIVFLCLGLGVLQGLVRFPGFRVWANIGLGF